MGFGRFLRSHTLCSSCLGVIWSRHWFTPDLRHKCDLQKLVSTGGDLDRLCTDKYIFYEYVPCVHSHTVGLGQATQGSVFGQEAVLQVDHSLPDLLVFGQHVVVINHHPKILLQREGAGELKHPAMMTGKRCGSSH